MSTMDQVSKEGFKYSQDFYKLFGCYGGNWLGAIKYLEPVMDTDPNILVKTTLTKGLGLTYDSSNTVTFSDKLKACS